jgi:hypothetical protein
MAPQKEVVLKLSSFRYRKEGVSEKEFHDYATKEHSPKAAVIQARHGALKVTQVQWFQIPGSICLIRADCLVGWQYHTPTTTKQLITSKIPWALRPGWEIDEHDIEASIWVRNTETLHAIIADPDFQKLAAGDDEICDSTRGKITAGWEEVFVEDGKIVDADYGTYEERSSVGLGSKETEAPAGIRL